MLSSASNPNTPFPAQPNSVYQYFDAHGILIYVGITGARSSRNRQHNADKAWWPFVVTQTVEHYESREAAHAREVALIRKFRPPFNKQHNFDHADLRAAYVGLQQSGRLTGVTAKDLLAIQGQRTLSMTAINDEKISFVTRLEDRPITECLRHHTNVPIHLDKTHVGVVRSLEPVNGLIKVVTSIHPAGKYVFRRAEARLRFITAKSPYVLELRKIEAFL